MKQKYCAFFVAVIALCCVLLGCQKNSSANPMLKQDDSGISAEVNQTTAATEPAEESDTTISDYTKPNMEVEVIESTPDSVVLEIGDGTEAGKSGVQMGVVEGSSTSDSGDDGTPNLSYPQETIPQPTKPTTEETPTTPPRVDPGTTYPPETTPQETKPTTEEIPTTPPRVDPGTTYPQETTPQETKPTTEESPISPPQSNSGVGPNVSTTYEEYEAMTGLEQTLFYYSFADADDFYRWYYDAKAKYEEGKNDIIVGDDGSVNMGDIANE